MEGGTITIEARVWYEVDFDWELRFMPDGVDAPQNEFHGIPCWGLFENDHPLDQWATLEEAKAALSNESYMQQWWMPDSYHEGCVEVRADGHKWKVTK